jgi:hypothetical protein
MHFYMSDSNYDMDIISIYGMTTMLSTLSVLGITISVGYEPIFVPVNSIFSIH